MIQMLSLALMFALTGPAEAGHYREEQAAAPAVVVEVDTGSQKDEPGMLAWSPDGRMLYVQTIERDRKGAIASTKHYLIAIAEKSIKRADGQPSWVGTYWAWKAAPASPAAAAFRIVPSERDEMKHAVAPVGEMAKGGSSGGGRGAPATSPGEVMAVAAGAQSLHIWSLAVNGETIGEWVNEAVTPGSSFSWAPPPAHAIVYARREGGPLTVLDDKGRKQPIAGAKNAFFPAWSDDGARIAWLERKDRRKYDLMIADVAAK